MPVSLTGISGGPSYVHTFGRSAIGEPAPVSITGAVVIWSLVGAIFSYLGQPVGTGIQ